MVRDGQQRFSHLLDAVPDAIVGIVPHDRITIVTGQAAELFGYQREELLGRSVSVIFSDSCLLMERPTMSLRHIELTGRRKDGHRFAAEVGVGRFELDDVPLTLAVVRDVTGRLENLGLRAGGIAHDFDNLMGVILDHAESVAGRVADDSVALAHVEEIRGAAERAAQLTRRLLDVPHL